MKKKMGVLIVCILIICCACLGCAGNGHVQTSIAPNPAGSPAQETSASPEPSEEGEPTATPAQESMGGAMPILSTTFVSEKELLEALQDKKAVEEDRNLQKVTHWYKLKNIPKGYVEYAVEISVSGHVTVQYITEETFQRAQQFDPKRVQSWEQPLTVHWWTGEGFDSYVSRNAKGGYLIQERVFYHSRLGMFVWMEGEDQVTVNMPYVLGEDNEYRAPELTDEEVLNLAQVVRVDPFK